MRSASILILLREYVFWHPVKSHPGEIKSVGLEHVSDQSLRICFRSAYKCHPLTRNHDASLDKINNLTLKIFLR